MDILDKIKGFWNKSFKDYDLHMMETNHYQTQEKILSLVLEQVEEPILDLACGTGFLVKKLSYRFSKVQGNDFLVEMINTATKDIEFPITNDDAETLDSYDNKFKTIISCNLFFYLQNRDRAIKRWTELLDPNGKIIFIEEHPFIKPKSEEMDKHTEELMNLIQPMSPDEIEKLMNQNGFSLIKKVETKIDEKHNLYGLVFSLR
jgi:ubiquinone/menaquinone biosynthesis C-methylase UbiE